ncbi:MAG: hypothetical protein OEY89_05970, partial [Gammaproteobacteria bacterium]|nr:hypothetical protein [Gammaproteobacteria bacterium]
QRVERTATNIVRGVVGLIPGGEQMYNNLQQSNAIQSAYQWFQLEIDKLNISWDLVKGLFMRTWDSLSLSDLASPASAFRRIRDIFTPTLQRIVRFSVACGQKILQFIFEGALRIAGPAGEQVLGVLRRAGDTINLIFSDPVAFGRNLINAVVQGFVQFKDNILSHLRTALLGWMFGTLAQAGIQMPETFDLKGLLSIALQILGLTYANLRRKLVRVIGERRVAFIETAVEFLTVIVRDGLMAAWQKILEYLGNLRDMVITAVRDWVVTRIVVAAVSRLATMFNPAGAIIQAVIAVYNTVMFLIERAQQIVAVVDSVFSSIGAIARGSISQAANFVEQTMGRVLPVIISFLARLIGLGGIANTIKGFIQNIQQRVDRVLTRVVNFIVQRARRLMSGARQAVGRIVQWWRTRKTFTAAGEEHALYFEGDENNAQLMINSTPQTVEHFLANANPSPSNHQAMESYNQARNLLRTVNNEIQAARRQRRQDAPAATEGAMETNLEQLKVKLQEHMSSMGGSVDIPPTHRTFGRLEHGELGTSMTARPLSIRAPENDGHPAGGPPAASPPIWDAVRHRYAGGRTYYIRGHLLNEQLHGPGIAENLSPITQDANREHENLAERRVKDQAWARHDRDSGEGQNQQGLAVEYSVRAVYGHHARSNTQALKSEVANLALADEQRARMNAILDNEEKLPTKFVCDAWLLNISAQNDFQRAQKFVDNIEITNTIPNTIPQLSEGGTPRRLTSMSTASADELGRISSVSLTASDIQYILSAQVSLNRNIRYFDQLKRSEQNPAGLTEEKINILINDSSIRVRPLNPV